MRIPVVLIAAALMGSTSAPPMVQVAQGSLAGAVENSIVVFKGIPYAAPPVGALRWRPPQPGPGWNGVRDAASFGPVCPQAKTPGLVARADLPQSEDCLTLNVWSPDVKPSAKLPVMVWIYGGGFTQGGSSVPLYDGAALARHGVVVVSFNYRLGRLGFFALDGLAAQHDGGSVADFGVLDQVAALKWVRRNIAAFGGDSANVTIFGESAGGVSVDALMVSPLARGLFAKAISESGPAAFGVETLSEAEAKARAFAKSRGDTGQGAVAKLRALPADSIIARGDEILGPIVDGAVLTEDITTAFAEGHFVKVPYLTGTNSNEGSLLDDAHAKAESDSHSDLRAVYERNGKIDSAEFGRLVFNDRFFGATTWLLARAVSKAGSPSYVYRFRFMLALLRRRGAVGVPHGGELPFVFGFGRLAALAPPTDLAANAMVQAYWTNFAKTGDPNGAGLPEWPRFQGPEPATLVINDTIRTVPDFRKAEIDAALRFWSARMGRPAP